MERIETNRTMFHYDQGEWSKREDTVVTEFALTIKLNEREFATMVCTPEYMEDLVVGFFGFGACDLTRIGHKKICGSTVPWASRT